MKRELILFGILLCLMIFLIESLTDNSENKGFVCKFPGKNSAICEISK
ncbi:hypothetical protein N752_29625 [Desulforamulus aquiferis]|nr:hypothetical protein N752_29625 [Desulforamulus aquiferis]